MSDERLVSYSIIGKPEMLHCTGQEASLFLFAFNQMLTKCYIQHTHTQAHTHFLTVYIQSSCYDPSFILPTAAVMHWLSHCICLHKLK